MRRLALSRARLAQTGRPMPLHDMPPRSRLGLRLLCDLRTGRCRVVGLDARLGKFGIGAPPFLPGMRLGCVHGIHGPNRDRPAAWRLRSHRPLRTGIRTLVLPSRAVVAARRAYRIRTGPRLTSHPIGARQALPTHCASSSRYSERATPRPRAPARHVTLALCLRLPASLHLKQRPKQHPQRRAERRRKQRQQGDKRVRTMRMAE